MHTVQLLLKTSKYERHEIDRRFHALGTFGIMYV